MKDRVIKNLFKPIFDEWFTSLQQMTEARSVLQLSDIYIVF